MYVPKKPDDNLYDEDTDTVRVGRRGPRRLPTFREPAEQQERAAASAPRAGMVR